MLSTNTIKCNSWPNGYLWPLWFVWMATWALSFLAQYLLFRHPFHPHVMAVECKSSQSLCQKSRWQVTAKCAFILCTWFCMKWRDMVHGCMVYTECAKTAAVSPSASHVTTKQHCKYTTLGDIQNALWKAVVTHLESLVTEVQWVCLRAENSAMQKQSP